MTWLRGPRSIWDSNSFSSIPISTRASLVLAATSDNSSEAVVEAEDLWGSRLKLLSASGQSALQSHLLSRIYKIAKRNWIYIGLKYFWKEHFFSSYTSHYFNCSWDISKSKEKKTSSERIQAYIVWRAWCKNISSTFHKWKLLLTWNLYTLKIMGIRILTSRTVLRISR